MGTIVVYQLGASPQRVSNIIYSANTPDFTDRTDVLINPNIPDISRDFMKVENGVIVEYTQSEKDAFIQSQLQHEIDEETLRINELDDVMTESQTVRLTKVEAMIDQISNLNDAKIFLKRVVRFLAKRIAQDGNSP